ncbi:MAG: hypothetical protein H0S82_07165 [Anaerolineaceae bacterium]|nr:hypothetical protein [Anaerolineaceae bacterium]
MSWYEWPLWLLLGAGTAFLFLLMQRWSVMQLSPDKPIVSQFLVLGGMFFRWALIALILVLALTRSHVAGLIVFAAFMVTRLVILAIWEKQWRLAAIKTNSQKD